jgi:hypothetical protein
VIRRRRRFQAAALAALTTGAYLALASPHALASGASPYLPLNLSPEIERQVERVLVLGGRPVLTRPVPVATVLEALPKACQRDTALCRRVKAYLDRYFGVYGLTEASVEVAAASHDTLTLPNQRGERIDAPVDGSVRGYFRPTDHLLLSAGAVGYAGTAGRIIPDGTMLSAGDEYLQLDAGYRPQWLSPLTDSSMLISTEAPTMPSVTLSNQEPISPLGFDYQFFYGRMGRSDHILHNGVENSGYPKLAGLHIGFEPLQGLSVAGSALYQFGGGGRPGSFKTFLNNLFKRTYLGSDTNINLDRRFANRTVSVTSAYTFPARNPFEAYVEYAGRDSFHGQFYRVRETDLSAGVHFPEFLDRFDLTLEVSEWQNAWYTDYVWLDGMAENGDVIGTWGADWRVPGDDVGARSGMIALGWPLRSGDEIYARLRALQNEHYGSSTSPQIVPYTRAAMLTLEYAQPRAGYTRGLELDTGRDTFNGNFARLAAFVRFDGGNPQAGEGSSDDQADEGEEEGAPDRRLERFVDAGVSGGKLGLDLGGFTPAQEAAPQAYRSVASPHLALGVRRAVSANGDLGVRVEFDDFRGAMIGLRMLDYRYRLDRHFALDGFLGFARYSGPTPAQGVYGGAGLSWRDLWPHWDLSLDVRYFDHVQRNKLLPGDPQNGDPVEWYTLQAPTLYLSYRF